MRRTHMADSGGSSMVSRLAPDPDRLSETAELMIPANVSMEWNSKPVALPFALRRKLADLLRLHGVPCFRCQDYWPGRNRSVTLQGIGAAALNVVFIIEVPEGPSGKLQVMVARRR